MGAGVKNKKAAVWYFSAALIIALALTARVLDRDGPLSQLACALAASAAIWRGSALLYGGTHNEKIMKRAVTAIFIIYLVLLINYTIFDGHFGRVAPEGASDVPLPEYFRRKGNLIPFKMIRNQTKGLLNGNYALRHYAVNVLGNLAAFAPLALFLPLLFKKCRKYPVFFAVTTAIILSVETCQLLLRVGSFDVDDYILNMAGATVVFLLLSAKKGKRITDGILRPE